MVHSQSRTAPPSNEDSLSLSWQGPAGLFSLSLANMLLRVLTLGIYHFWAKTEVRKRIWSAIRLNGEPLAYTGRGLELFVGFVIVFFVILLPLMLVYFALALQLGPHHRALDVVGVTAYVLLAYLFGIASYRAQRYRLARTRWRGIRGSLEGSPMRYAWIYFWTLMLIPFTLGWIMPWRTTILQSIITNNVRFGNRPLRFDGKSGPLYGPFALLWFGSIVLYLGLIGGLAAYYAAKFRTAPTSRFYWPDQADVIVVVLAVLVAALLFALISSWYQARIVNHFARHTHFENATFDGHLTAGGLIWLNFTNFLILLAGVVVLGAVIAVLAAPFFDFQNLRAPEGRAVMQVLMVALPFAVILGFTLFSPIVQARSAGYIVRNLAITGTAPLAEITQAAGADLKYGEGLAEAFDVDAF